MANIYDRALEFKKQLEAMDEATLKLITAEYNRTLAKLKSQFIYMSERAREYSLEHPAPTPYELGRLKEIRQAIQDVEAEVARLHGVAADKISKCQEAYMYKVPEHYEELVNNLADEYGAEDVHFAKVNPKAFEKMAGFTSEGSPLIDVLERHAGLKKDNIISILRHGVLVGENPEAMARKMTKAGHSDLGHALLVARTETMRVAQEVGNENFKANGIDMVQWVSGETAFTCAACWAMSGKIFEVGKQPHDHPNGRCVFNPYIPELAEYDPELYKHDPEENFAKLSEKEQLEILGLAKFEMWKNSELKLGDLASVVSNPDYGYSIRIKSLVDLKSEPAGSGGIEGSLEPPKMVAVPYGAPEDSPKETLKLDKTPAEEYNVDKRFHETFNSMTPDMQKLFAPYLKKGEVDPDFDDSEVEEFVRNSKGYKSPLELGLIMQDYAKKYDVVFNDGADSDTPIYLSAINYIKKHNEGKPKAQAIYDNAEYDLDHWIASSNETEEAILMKRAASILYGGGVFNPENIRIFDKNRQTIAHFIIVSEIHNNSIRALHEKYPSGVIKLYRGVYDCKGDFYNALDSWTDDKSIAEEWAYSNATNYGYVLSATFDIDMIVGSYIEDYFYLKEQKEYIVSGGLSKDVKITRKRINK